MEITINIVDFPIKDGDFPQQIVRKSQEVVTIWTSQASQASPGSAIGTRDKMSSTNAAVMMASQVLQELLLWLGDVDILQRCHSFLEPSGND